MLPRSGRGPGAAGRVAAWRHAPEPARARRECAADGDRRDPQCPHQPETTPIQAALNRAGHGTIQIAGPYRDGLAGLDGFGYAWLLTWLHRPGARKDAGDRKEPGAGEGRAGRAGLPPLRQVPFLLRRQRREMGIFATRGPRRVNPIGLSLIQLLKVTPETVLFAGVDVIDGTPVIDLKPYVTGSTARLATRPAAGSTRWPSTRAAPPPGWPGRSRPPDGRAPDQVSHSAPRLCRGRNAAPLCPPRALLSHCDYRAGRACGLRPSRGDEGLQWGGCLGRAGKGDGAS